jgi:PAS domain S-box-containing protein
MFEGDRIVHPIAAIAEDRRDIVLRRFEERVQELDLLRDRPSFQEATNRWMVGVLDAFREDLAGEGPDTGVAPCARSRGGAIAAFVATEVRAHRARGVPLEILIGCAQAARDALRDVLGAAAQDSGLLTAEGVRRALAVLDGVEMVACRAWEELDQDSRVAKHRAAAREEADERERYQNLVDGLPAAVFVLDGMGQVVLGNRPAADLCGPSVYGWRRPGVRLTIDDLLPEMGTEVEAFLGAGVEESSIERQVMAGGSLRRLQIRMRRRGDGSEVPSGVVMMVSDLTAMARAGDDPSTARAEMGRRVRESSDDVLRLSASLLAEAEGRSRSEQDCRMTASKLEAVFRVVPDLFFHLGVDGRFKEYMGGQEGMMAMSPSEFMGRTVTEVMPKPIGELIAGGIRQAAESRSVVVVEYPMDMTDGEHHYEARLVAIAEDDVVAIVRDDTARRRAERIVEESEERYRLLVDLSPYGIAVHQDGRIVFANPAALGMFGARTPEDLIGRPIMDVVHTDWRDLAREQVESMYRDGITIPTIEERFLRMDGTSVEVEVAAGPTKFKGRPAIQVVVRDISERKRAEENYRSIVDSAVEGIYQCTVDGEVFSANPALARMLGYDGQPSMGADPGFNGMTLHGGAGRWEEFLRAIESGDAVHGFEFESARVDGRAVWLSENARILRDSDGRGSRIIGMVEDVTQRRDLEQRLRHAQKMEAVGRLAGGIAHDFNNLLTAITGYSALLLDELDRESPLRLKVDEILSAGRRAAALTGQLLVFSRRQVLQPAVLDLNRVVSGMDGLLRRLLGEDVLLHKSLAPELGAVRADEGQLEQVVMNLLVNARDAMQGGGVIVLTTGDVEVGVEGENGHGDLPAGRWVMLSVVDTGVGMDAETCSHVFEPFFTTKGPGKGTGLGLAVVYGIVQQSGGRVVVDSEIGRGTTFRVYLPRVEGKVEAQPTRLSPKMASGGGETVLVAEDEDAVRGFTVAVLTERGYRVLEARDGFEALDVAGRFGHAIDLLLTDVVMPGMNGRDLARRLLALRPTMRVVFTSGYTDGDAAFLGLAETGSSFLPKPFLPEALAGVVRLQLNRTSP